MPKTYSTYEAKARLSELLDRVRQGDVVTITHRGTPLAEVRPVQRSEDTLSARLDDLRRRGILTPPSRPRPLRPLSEKKGALQRFLDSRE